VAAPKGTRELRPLTDYCLLLAPPENCVINAIVDVMLSLGVEFIEFSPVPKCVCFPRPLTGLYRGPRSGSVVPRLPGTCKNILPPLCPQFWQPRAAIVLPVTHDVGHISSKSSASPAMGHWGTSSLGLAHVHQSGSFYLRITPMGSDRLLVNITRFSVPITGSQSLKWLNVSLLYL